MDTIINVTAASIIIGLVVCAACLIAGWFGYKAGKAATIKEHLPDYMTEEFYNGFIAGEKAARRCLSLSHSHSHREEHKDAQ